MTDAPPAPGSVAHAMSQPSMLMAAVEAGGVQAFLSFIAQAVAQVLRAGLGPASPHAADAVGAARVLLSLGVFSVLYSQRFRRGVDASAATLQTARCVAAAWLPRVDGVTLLLLAFHAAQLAALTSPWVLGGAAPPSLAAATACMSRGSLLWGVAWEELVYRAIVFYVVLQRSGGRVGFSVVCTALLFGAVHAGSALKTPGGGALVALQCVGAALFGVTYAALFAATGSLGATMLVHAANNAVALVWVAVDPSRPPEGVLPCAPVYSHALAGSVAAQAVVYLAGAALAYRSLARALATPTTPGGGGGATASNAFRDLHPLVYGGPEAALAVVGVPAAAGAKKHE